MIIKIDARIGHSFYPVWHHRIEEDFFEGQKVTLSLKKGCRRVLRNATVTRRESHCTCGCCDPESYLVFSLTGSSR